VTPVSPTPLTRPSNTPIPSVLPSDAPPRGTLVFGSASQFRFDGDAQSDLYLFPDTVVWSSAPWRSTQPPLRPGAGRIQELVIATGQVRTLYEAPSENSFVTVKASADWLTWLETTDPFGLRDARLLAMPRRGGVPIVIDELKGYATASFPMWCIDGADVYWTIPETRTGQTVGPLRHKHLADGASEIVVPAQPGQTIALPSAYRGVLAYEVRGGPEAHVNIRLPDGTTRDVGVSPASEPTAGDGFVAFKRANVATAGQLAAVLLASGTIVSLGIGEQPRAGESWLAWGSWSPDPLDPASASPVFISNSTLACIARFKRPLPNANSTVSIPSVAGGRVAWLLSDNDKPQLDRLMLVVEDLRELRC